MFAAACERNSYDSKSVQEIAGMQELVSQSSHQPKGSARTANASFGEHMLESDV